MRSVVTGFGHELKQVPLTADPEIAAQAIREHYTAWVTPSLLDSWIRNPYTAPGRAVSSPWPDRIEIDSILAVSRTRYRVTGHIVEVTSANLSGRSSEMSVPVDLILDKQNGGWFISECIQKLRPEKTNIAPPDTSMTESEVADANAAKDVLIAYYDAINKKEYARAYALWASLGEASGKTLEEFTNGFARTESVALIPGQPGRIEGAAGSRYIEIPVTIEARLSDGKEQHFTGMYTLRRSVVDGATAEQRAWRIYKAHIVASR